ncbi:ABC transporter substrate-binding protein [Mastigocoleus sp. MO_188.B34]|uniref:ABC transporter substrate-binding protein n=1 Tax=Mastigocoleus sp. MO_188.B34 TaxID=3036635 RepID=UPI0026341199|nr:ABC transporter substrate-binding protein [Mastigocoleus sp. MO_188.B34]MDJ0698170.1 ABC transporter substrate-binding protein [Mastigocoleus sp. MO_188.B34]
MKKSLFSFLITLVAITVTIIGCQVTFINPTRNTNSQGVTVKLSGWGASPTEQKLLKQVLKDFEAANPGIKVKYEEISDQYMDVIKTRLIGDAAPDVFYLDGLEAPFLMSHNVLEPLNDYITPEFELSDFQPVLLNSFKYNDQIYGLPKDYSTLALFYNLKAFNEAGLEKPPVTWDELRLYSRKLTTYNNKDNRVKRYGFGETLELARQAYKIKAFDGQIVDKSGNAVFASPSGLKGLQLVVDQYIRDRTSAQKTDVGTNSGSEMFGQGKVAMAIEGNWTIPYLQETYPQLEFATAEVPRINGKAGTMSFTVAYVMNKQTKHKPEAWKLISYLTGKEGMEKWTSKGFALASRKSVAQKLGYEQDPLRSALVAGVNYATPWEVGKYPAAIVNSFDNQFLSAMLGEQSLEQAMVRAQNTANKQIQMMEY